MIPIPPQAFGRLTPADRTNMFASSYIYNFPFFKNRRGIVGQALGHWTFSGMTALESGFPLTISLATPTAGLATRPNCIGTVGRLKNLNEWFNTGAFAAPEFGFFGNCGTSIVRGPGEEVWDWSLFKTFPIGERFRLQFRGEIFNIWNHPNFSGVATGYAGTNSTGQLIGNFGEVVSAEDPREVQLALRLSF